MANGRGPATIRLPPRIVKQDRRDDGVCARQPLLAVANGGTHSARQTSHTLIRPKGNTFALSGMKALTHGKRAQGQCRQDRQWRIGKVGHRASYVAPLPTPRPLIGKPHRQLAALTHAGLVGEPIRDLVLLPRDVVAAIPVELERQGGRPRLETGVLPMPAGSPAPMS